MYFCIAVKGTPNDLQAQNEKREPITVGLVPTRDEAVKYYEDRGGQLTFWPEFGTDPLSGQDIIASRHSNEFNINFPNLNDIFYEVINNDLTNFRRAISLYRDLKYKYCC